MTKAAVSDESLLQATVLSGINICSPKTFIGHPERIQGAMVLLNQFLGILHLSNHQVPEQNPQVGIISLYSKTKASPNSCEALLPSIV